MKKYLALVLVLVLSLTSFVLPAAAEDNRPVIQVTIFDRSAVPADQGTYEDNWATRWINENSPVKVEFVACPRGSTYANFNLWLASGEAPDIIMEFQPEYVEEWSNNGMLIDMKPYLDEYAPNYRALTPESVQQWGIYNGGEYAIAQQRFEPSVVNHMLYVRKDWLDNLGLAVPTTEEEWLEVVQAFTEKDPDGNGKNDTWGWSFAGHYGQILNSAYKSHTEWYKQEDGTINHKHMSGAAMKVNELQEKILDNGWADKEYLSYDAEARHTMFVNGQVGFLATEHANLATKVWANLKANFPEAEVVPVPSWTGNGYYQERECQFLSSVPTTCDNPEAVAMYIDWMITDGWKMLAWGEEGVDFEDRDGLYVDLLTADQRAQKLAYTNEYAIVNPYGMTADLYVKAAEARIDDEAKEGYLIDAQAVMATKDIKFVRDLPTNNLGVQEALELMTDMNTFAAEEWAKALADKDYTSAQAQEAIKAEWEMMDFQIVYDAMNEKAKELGII